MTSPPPEWGPGGAPPPTQPPPPTGGSPGSDSPPRPRHRLEPDTGFRAGVTARRLVAPVVAVLAVVAVVGALLFIGRQPVSHGQTAAVSQDIRGATTTSPNSLGTPPAASSSRSRSHHRSSPAHPTPKAKHSSHRHHQGSGRHVVAAPPAAPAMVPVTVLNNSRIQGLAHHVAAELAERGWPIAQIGNYTGRLRETTLFYLAGQQGAADQLAGEFPGFAGIPRLEPRPADLPGAGLTLVVTRYWQS